MALDHVQSLFILNGTNYQHSASVCPADLHKGCRGIKVSHCILGWENKTSKIYIPGGVSVHEQDGQAESQDGNKCGEGSKSGCHKDGPGALRPSRRHEIDFGGRAGQRHLPSSMRDRSPKTGGVGAPVPAGILLRIRIRGPLAR